MDVRVKKRDGRVVAFDRQRIIDAIFKAMQDCGNNDINTAAKLGKEISDSIPDGECWSVDQIQVLVENRLMTSDMPDVARAYIIYRNKRDKARNSKANQVIADIIAAKSNDITKENANMNTSTPAGMMMKIASERSKEYAMDYLLNEETVKAINDNLIHVHDLDMLSTRCINCLQHPVERILSNGFKAGHGESRPAKRIETASMIACISLETIQNECFGGQAIPAFDFYMAPYVRKTYEEEVRKIEQAVGLQFPEFYKRKIDEYQIRPVDKMDIGSSERFFTQAVNMTVSRVHQAMEALIHNLNQIHSRGGNQVVFSSLNYGTDTSAEGRCVIRELLLSTEQGVGSGATAIFPIHVFKKKRGVNFAPGDKNYDLFQLACRVTAKRFFPNFINLDATYNQSELWREDDPKRYENEVATMGCRTRVFEDRFGKKTSIARGNLSFTTLNLPGIAMTVMKEADKAKRLQNFYKLLDNMIAVIGQQLYERYQMQCTAVKTQFPLLMSGMWTGSEFLKPEDPVGKVLKHGTLGVGFIGLAECLVALVGKHHGESEESQKLGLQIVGHINDKVHELSDKYDLNYSTFATPAEGLSGKFTKKDKKKFGIIPGITDRDYYTNSNHVPVYYHCSAAHKAEVEGPYHDLTRGGHIFYVEMDSDATQNIEAIQQIVELADKNNIGYVSVNHNVSRCEDCGYESGTDFENGVCPRCNSTRTTYLARITGYLTANVNKWNSGKEAEFKDRVKHGI